PSVDAAVRELRSALPWPSVKPRARGGARIAGFRDTRSRVCAFEPPRSGMPALVRAGGRGEGERCHRVSWGNRALERRRSDRLRTVSIITFRPPRRMVGLAPAARGTWTFGGLKDMAIRRRWRLREQMRRAWVSG